MKVLLISYHFPPDPAVGSIRAARVREALRRAGHEVHVIAPRLAGEAARTDHAAGIHHVRRLPNARELALAVRNAFRRPPAPAAGSPDRGGYVPPANVPQWKRFLVAMALLPDDQQGFIIPALARALRLHRRHRFDLVYTSGPPHSAHVSGLWLKWLTGIRWAAEFRDPWTDNAMQPRYARSETAHAVKSWLERKTLSTADHIIAVSESAGRLFAGKTPRRSDHILVVRNGVERMPAAPAPPISAIKRITYLGNLYHRRDPGPILRALAALRRSGHLGPPEIALDFYGHCRWYHDISIEEEVRTLGIADWIQFHDPIPQRETLAVMARSDLLLLLAQDQPLQIPQKLYEYLAARRPILAFGDRDGETTLMLRAAGGHYLVCEDDPGHIEQVLLRALSGNPDSRPRFDPLEEWSVDREMGRLVEAIAPAATEPHSRPPGVAVPPHTQRTINGANVDGILISPDSTTACAGPSLAEGARRPRGWFPEIRF